MLLNKYAFSWTTEATQTFQNLKEAMCKAPVLMTPDFTKTFIVECDASAKWNWSCTNARRTPYFLH